MDTAVEEQPPALGDMLLEPRPYQRDAVLKILGELDRVPSTLAVMPTGVGKTETALLVARCVIEEGGRVLFLAHTDELVNQPLNKAAPIGLAGVKEKAGDHACPPGDDGGAGLGLGGNHPGSGQIDPFGTQILLKGQFHDGPAGLRMQRG